MGKLNDGIKAIGSKIKTGIENAIIAHPKKAAITSLVIGVIIGIKV